MWVSGQQYRPLTFKIESRAPFFTRLWYMISNPFLYLFTGKKRY